MSTWTEEHELFCYQNRIPPAAKSLWFWLVTQGKEGRESEPDLQEFNQWVAKKRGKPYGQTYLRKMYGALVENKVVTEIKKFTWRIYRVIVKPLEWLKPPKPPSEKKVQNLYFNSKTQGSNTQSVVDEVKQQQLNLNQEILAEEGIEFDIKETEVLDRPTLEVKVAIALYKIRGGAEKVQNPEGMIRKCLREKWWTSKNNQKALNAYFPCNSKVWDDLKE